MKKDIAGPKKSPQDTTAIRDPKTGELLVNKNASCDILSEYNARLTRNVLAWLFALFAKNMTTLHCRSLGACYVL